MNQSQWQNQIVPARLSFLAIYNPALGPTDDTFRDQLVYYHSRAAHETRTTTKKSARNDAAGGDAMREVENEKLRQIGLAQGMVDFARSFSEGESIDSVDTEKSRIVLHELEAGWWILASIDLTRLPSTTHTTEESEKQPAVEYSSREVSPPALLVQQLLQAHYVFTLHHGPSLSDLWVRLSREKFCATLERYWNRFSRSWDVLLHGNPAVDIFGGIQLSSGGELGMGVGEEEWGSGEREVLEDLTHRTEGLVDLIVCRFGEPAGDASVDEAEAPTWIGNGNYPAESDGVIFGGINAISRSSLRSVSLWMRQIYTFGDHAYGVRDNPLRERRARKRRGVFGAGSDVSTVERRNDNARHEISELEPGTTPLRPQGQQRLPSTQSTDQELEDEISTQVERHPKVPTTIVTAAEQSLNQTTHTVDTDDERTAAAKEAREEGSTMGIPDQYMKYLTLGLSTLGKPSSKERPEKPRRTSTSSFKTVLMDKKDDKLKPPKSRAIAEVDEDASMLTQMKPIPDGEGMTAKIALQKRLENAGHFVIGLKGNLEEELPDHEDTEITDGSSYHADTGGTRTVLRTVHVQLPPGKSDKSEQQRSYQKERSNTALTDASTLMTNTRRVRVLIYVHRPFMYCFLFQDRTPALSVTHFYRNLHQNLKPIHKPLLSSTSASKFAQRVQEAQSGVLESDTASIASGGGKSPSKETDSRPIYDLVYDPSQLTIHTSIPNISEPGTPAAEGIFSRWTGGGATASPGWNRVEALNVHSQILNSLASTQYSPTEYERASKTSRGWWIVWMKLPAAKDPSDSTPPPEQTSESDTDENVNRVISFDQNSSIAPRTEASPPRKPSPPLDRIAFVVRKASDSAISTSTSQSRATSSMWNALSLRPGPTIDEKTGGAGAGWGPAALTGGMGIDARKYIEGLLSLNR